MATCACSSWAVGPCAAAGRDGSWPSRRRSAPGRRWRRARPCLPRMQSPSHWLSCGQTRPVTQGSALSSSSDSAAPSRSPSRLARHEAWDVDAHRAAIDAGRVLALQAALGLGCARTSVKPRLTSVKSVARISADALRHRRAGRLPSAPWASAWDRCARSSGGSLEVAFAARLSTMHSRRSKAACSKLPIGGQSVGQQIEIDLVRVELRAVHAGVSVSPPTVTRQPPHMPVPSTMIALSETIVGTSYRA